MLRFLSSLFSSPEEQTGQLNEALIDAAIERAVDGTDTRIRLLRNYRKRLRGPVTTAAAHVIGLVDRLPEPTQVGKSTFATDARIRAFFASVDHLNEVVGGFQTVRSYLKTVDGLLPERVFGLLTMARQQRTVFGMAMEAEQLRRDVQQVAVSFSDHRYICPTGSETDTRWELTKRGYDFLLERALARIATATGKRVALEGQRKLLERKHKMMQAGNWGLELTSGAGAADARDAQSLEAEIAATEKELLALGADAGAIERSLEYLIDILDQPNSWLSIDSTTLHLDYRGIKVDPAVDNAMRVELLELRSGRELGRVALLAWIARADLPEPPNLFEQASRYLL